MRSLNDASRCSARRWSPSRPARRQAGQPRLYRGRLGYRPRALSLMLVDRAHWADRVHRLHRGRHGHRGGRRRDAREDPDTLPIDPAKPGSPFHAAQLVGFALGTGRADQASAMALFKLLYKAFTEKDMSLLEINPLIIDGDGISVCSMPRCRSTPTRSSAMNIMELRDETEEDEKEIEASKYDLAYVALDGEHRLHGQRRGPRDGDHGHHQALRRRSPPTSSMSAAARPRRR
jgi:hypothetical protein